MTPDEWRLTFEFVKTVGVVLAGGWALWIFAIQRRFSPQIEFDAYGKPPRQYVGADAPEPIGSRFRGDIRHDQLPCAATCPRATRARLRNRRARRVAIGAEHTAVAGFWLEPRAAPVAVIEKLARAVSIVSAWAVPQFAQVITDRRIIVFLSIEC
jgi:hypothetical protein